MFMVTERTDEKLLILLSFDVFFSLTLNTDFLNDLTS